MEQQPLAQLYSIAVNDPIRPYVIRTIPFEKVAIHEDKLRKAKTPFVTTTDSGVLQPAAPTRIKPTLSRHEGLAALVPRTKSTGKNPNVANLLLDKEPVQPLGKSPKLPTKPKAAKATKSAKMAKLIKVKAIKATKPARTKTVFNEAKPVVCLLTKEYFASLQRAAIAVKGNFHGVERQIASGNPERRYKGHHFAFATPEEVIAKMALR